MGARPPVEPRERRPRAGFAPALAFALGALAGCGDDAPTEPPGAPEVQAPPAPRPALRTLLVESRLVFAIEGAPRDPHVLEFSWTSAGRARWRLALEAGPASQRSLKWMNVDVAHSLDPGAKTSRELPPEELANARLQAAARAALFTPRGGGDAPTRIEVADAGAVELEVDERGRVARARTLALDGAVRENLVVTAWRADAGPAQPAALELRFADDRLIWREEVTSARDDARFLNAYFVPPDLRERLGGTQHAESAARRVEVSEFWLQLQEARARTTWKEAFREARALQSGDPERALVLVPRYAEPRGAGLRVHQWIPALLGAGAIDPADASWRRHPGGPAMVMAAGGAESADPSALLEAMVQSAGDEGLPDGAWVTLPSPLAAPPTCDVVLPLENPENTVR